MNDLSLVIPAKNEKDSLPKVLDELKSYNLEIIIVLEESDKETINSIKDYKCKLIHKTRQIVSVFIAIYCSSKLTCN